MSNGAHSRLEARSASTSGLSASATPSFCEAASSERMLGEARPAARVDPLADAGGLEPALPGVAAGDELHRVVVQEDVVREVGGLAQRRSALNQFRACHRGHRNAEKAVGAIARVVTAAEMDLDARGVLAQVEPAHQRR